MTPSRSPCAATPQNGRSRSGGSRGGVDRRARPAFDALSYSRRRQLVGAIESAKRPETRAKRIDRAVAAAG
ncbi:YdeI/OmpD-associated family protein [Nocardia amikacinitolerans]|uniref:YdeI/OmpD-associated family protein n=1 Tax=Nocardia amikacinitolerans TaxID=756689 RepID=UPI000ACE386C|nr:YdeI/OmpD-associated family protein [Nocardia amikacinitolerans]